jgi:hypothetical protein
MEGTAPIIRLASGFEPRPKNGDNNIANNNKSLVGNAVQCSPFAGPEGTEVTVTIQSPLSDVGFKIAFGSLVVNTKQMSSMNMYTLIATAPNHVLTNCASYVVPISVCAYKGDSAIQTWTVGRFNYVSNDKRRRSSSLNYSYQKDVQDSINKRNSTGSMPNGDLYSNPSYPQAYQGFSGASYQNDQVPTLYQSYTPMEDAYSIRPPGQPQLGQMMNYEQYDQGSVDLLSPAGNGMPNVNLNNMNNIPFFENNSNIYQQQNPYPYQSAPVPRSRAPVYGNDKINLDINGDLSTMAQGWTQDEWINRRRLVQFWRKQEGSKITCGFQPVSQNSRLQDSIVISCIFWEQRNECYITSVDCIYLLESLIGVRFSIEEKNRIRRNLEGFRPATVSKSKAESTEFFKLIMSFPNPKPRNIEKDVKVFKWKVLPFALKKIVAKYTSTAHSLDRRSRSPISHGHSSSEYSMPGQRTPSPLTQSNGQSQRSPYLTPTYGQHDMRRLSTDSTQLEQSGLSPQSIHSWSRSPSPMQMSNIQALGATGMDFPNSQTYPSYTNQTFTPLNTTDLPMASDGATLSPNSATMENRSPLANDYNRSMNEQMMVNMAGNSPI